MTVPNINTNTTQPNIPKSQMPMKPSKGGKVIGSGGFGCIFKPAIKCKDKKRDETDITKLMKKKYATSEFKNIEKYRKMLENIPNYEDYFLVNGFSVCEPDKLTNDDINAFDKKCSALKKMKIKSTNVNDSLGKLTALNMPYGGVDVGDYIENIKMDYKKLKTINDSLIELLKNGVLPMNDRGIYHCDIKDSNILVDERDFVKTGLIDWGLSTTYESGSRIPKPLTNRPFQYNAPFSVILFNDTFATMYSAFLKKNKDLTYFSVRSFVITYVITWINKRGPGHLRSLNNIFKSFFERGLINIEEQFKDDIIEFEYTFYFIFEYISQIVYKFTKDGAFDKQEYFSRVFLKNLDIWGFVMTYLPIAEYLDEYYTDLCECEIEILEKIKNIILYVIECSYITIDSDKVITKLKELNELFSKAVKNSKVVFKEKESSATLSTSKKTTRTKRTSRSNSSKSKTLKTSHRTKSNSNSK